MIRGVALAFAAGLMLIACAGSVPGATTAMADLADLEGPYQTEPFAVLDRALVAELEAQCREPLDGAPTVDREDKLGLADARGAGHVILMFRGPSGQVTACFGVVHADGTVTLDSVDAANPGDPPAAPRGPLEITSAIGLAGDDAHGPWSSSIGLAGTEVGAVVIELRDGTRVVASLANGMWAASWPGRHVEVRILVYDGTGDVVSEQPM